MIFYVGTFHHPQQVGIASYMVQEGYELISNSHYHPRGTSESSSDQKFAKYVRSKNPNASFSILVTNISSTQKVSFVYGYY